jgi:lipopolysaccharide export system permease protein
MSMTVLTRYLLKEILKVLGIILILVVSIYIFIDFIEKSGKFVRAGVPLARIAVYFCYNIPFVLSQIAPLGILLSCLLVLGLMNKHNEIIALKSCGVSIYVLLRPLLAVGAAMSLLLFFVSNALVPEATQKANQIWLKEVRGNKIAVTGKERNIWITGKRKITHIGYLNPIERTIAGVSIYIFGENFQLIRRVDAQRGEFRQEGWVLTGIMDQRLDQTGKDFVVTFVDELAEPLDFSIDDLKRMAKKSGEMNFGALHEYIRKIEAEGYDAAPYRVDLHGKIAWPLVCVIMCILATAIAVRRNLREGAAIGIAFGVGSAFMYWVTMSFCISLGYGGILPPFLAAWTANFIFICIGGILLLNAE